MRRSAFILMVAGAVACRNPVENLEDVLEFYIANIFRCAAAGTIAVGANTNGSLASTDCRVENSFVDRYELRLDTGTNLTINLASIDFDPFLRVIDQTGTLVTEDNDSGGSSNARITRFFPAGTYHVAVTSFNVNGTGQYSLAIN